MDLANIVVKDNQLTKDDVLELEKQYKYSVNLPRDFYIHHRTDITMIDGTTEKTINHYHLKNVPIYVWLCHNMISEILVQMTLSRIFFKTLRDFDAFKAKFELWDQIEFRSYSEVRNIKYVVCLGIKDLPKLKPYMLIENRNNFTSPYVDNQKTIETQMRKIVYREAKGFVLIEWFNGLFYFSNLADAELFKKYYGA